MRPARLLGLALVFLGLLASRAPVVAAADSPSAPTPQGPVEPLSPARARIVLNGLWSFQPAVDAAAREPSADWGAIWVPGTWLGRGHWGSPRLPGVERKGASPLWQKLNDNLPSAWYERSFDLPADWQGRRVELDLRRVSTDAQVWLNGRQVGEVRWPFGRVDLTPALRPGQNTLRLLVVASTENAEQIDYMGYANESRSLARLHAAGIVGDVILESSPAGGAVSDIFAKPSVRRSELGVEIELDRVPRPGPVALRLSARRAGSDAVVFSAETTVQAVAGKQTFDLVFPWTDSARWDLDAPALHVLRVEAVGSEAGVSDVRDQRFGFREFWIEGRQLVLNGVPLHLRPTLAPGNLLNGTPESHAGLISGMKAAGFNISQVWPESVESRRGQYHFWDRFYSAASEAGWPVIGVWPSLNDFFQDARGNATWTARRAEYAALAEAVIRRVRNEPSVLLWGTTGNYFNHGGDQDPRNLGRDYRDTAGLRHNRDAEWRDALSIARRVDSTRPIFTHAGNTYGDLYSTNHYLNLVPLQEREEWLSEWARSGEKPFLAVEFGTPLHTNFHRGRNGYGGAVQSEPLLTEFLAGFFGPDAYRAETLDYRRQVVAMKHQQGQKWEAMHSEPLVVRHPQFQELQARFIRNTWRAWRADGVSAGMIPWALESLLWRQRDPAGAAETAAAPAFAPGRLGPWLPRPDLRATGYLQAAGGWTPLPGGQALAEVNGPTLAWIAGGPGPDAIHDKAHNFSPGEPVAKQIVVLNDLRAPADYAVAWTATVAGREIARGESSGRLAPATQDRIPLAFAAPAVPAAAHASGEITLRATVAGRAHTDVFAFRVHGAPAPLPASTWLAFDPQGDTSAYLHDQGVSVAPWNGQPARDAILAIGRRALSSGAALPGDLRAFVAAGGRLVVFAQDPDWYRSIGLRVSRQVLREVFPVDPAHPLFAGLEAADLRDWRGAGSLVEARPSYAKDRIPTHGWRWGNRHSVTSAAIEKPHRAGWRPLLECDFDLAYSPLLELDLGAGRAWLCTLDFEARGERDPAADDLFRRFARHVAESEARPRASRTVYVGDAEGARLLRDLAVEFTQETRPPSASRGALLIVGNGANIAPAILTQWASSGGNVFVLPGQKGGEDHFGAPIVLSKRFAGSLTPPPSPLGDGLGLSDLRLRSTADFRVVGPGGAARPYADGLIGVQRPGGAGWIVHSQLNPRFADLEEKPYFRYTAWRLTRANAQLLANLGAAFTADAQFFAPRIERIGLAGEWRAKLTAPLPQHDWRNPQRDPGPSPLAQAAARPGFDASAWETVRLPGYWKPALDEADGEAVFTRTVRIPADWRGQVLLLSLGRIDNFDEVFVNGVRVGGNPQKPEDPKFNPWNQLREYRIAADQIASSELTITVRVFDQDSGGGVHGRDDEMFLRVLDPSIRQDRTFYSPDYREDHELGDDPHRYYRW